MQQRNAERTSARELVSSRVISAERYSVFEAWTNPETFKKWWVPRSAPITLLACEMDVRAGGTYRLVFKAGEHTAEFFGKYIDVTPPSRLVWTNEEGGADASILTTVTFEAVAGGTLVVVHDAYPSEEALTEALTSGSSGAMPEQLEQLQELFAAG